MKFILTGMLAGLIAATTLQAQNPTWAEQIHKRKTGVYPAGVEQRLKDEKAARAQQAPVATSDLFAALDHNRDGVISAQEWQVATQSTTPAPAVNQ